MSVSTMGPPGLRRRARRRRRGFAFADVNAPGFFRRRRRRRGFATVDVAVPGFFLFVRLLPLFRFRRRFAAMGFAAFPGLARSTVTRSLPGFRFFAGLFADRLFAVVRLRAARFALFFAAISALDSVRGHAVGAAED
jgi:hypothetical protein